MKQLTTTKIVALFFLLIGTTSCMFDGIGIKGNGNIVDEGRKISAEFNGIKVSQGIHVYLSQGEETSLNVEADENIIDLLVTEVEGDILKIYFDKNVSRAKARNVYLTINKISSIKTSSGSSVETDGTLKTKNLKLNASSGAHLDLSLNASAISCSASSGAHIKLEGSASSIKSNASSGSHIKAANLITKSANASVSSGAGISLFASEELTANASSGGNISYKGDPSVVNKSKSSGGSISKH